MRGQGHRPLSLSTNLEIIPSGKQIRKKLQILFSALFFNFNGQVEAQNDVDWPCTLPPGTWQSTCSGNKITFDQATHKCKLETTCDDHLGTPKDTTIEWEVHFISYDQFQNCDGVL